MKINNNTKFYIPSISSDSSSISGKHSFCYYLGNSLLSRGYYVTDDISIPVDISLNLGSIKHNKSTTRIIRYDGICHNSMLDYCDKNSVMSCDIDAADGIIYQSTFSKKMCNRYLGSRKCASAVIRNKIDIDAFINYSNLYLNKYHNKKVFMAFARWRPHKRLLDTIESFLLASVEDSVLIIAGDTTNSGVSVSAMSEYCENKCIEYVGTLPHNHLSSYLKIAVANIHLCWLDWCPNSVVESIAAGVPTITNNVGGTRELIKLAGGIICNIDKKYKGAPVDLHNPPKINRRIVADAIVKCSKNKIKVDNTLFDIKYAADEYIELCKHICKKEYENDSIYSKS